MKWWLVLAALWLPWAAQAGPSSEIAGQTLVSNQASVAAFRNIRICGAGDIQNMASADDDLDLEDGCAPQTGGSCAGEFCTKSPYCEGSWYNTGGILLRNMALSMAGESRLIDYSRIRGTDPAPIFPPVNPDHEKCDIVLLPGDLMDTGDADTNPPTARDLKEWANVNLFLNTLDAYGVPWIAAKGNHDSEILFQQINARLNASPYFYNDSADGLSHALLIPTRAGQKMCLIAITDTPSESVGNDAFLNANVGCGGNHPTIFMSHSAVANSQTVTTCSASSSAYTNLVTAGKEKVWLVFAGHTTPNPPIGLCIDSVNPAAWAGTPKLYRSNVNTQELDRHNYGSNPPYGNTASDNVGGVYLVIDLDVANDRITFHAWNPYYQTRDSVSGRYITTTLSEAFDFDTRFPP